MILIGPDLTVHNAVSQIDLMLYSSDSGVVTVTVDQGGLDVSPLVYTMSAGEKKTLTCNVFGTGKTYTVTATHADLSTDSCTLIVANQCTLSVTLDDVIDEISDAIESIEPTINVDNYFNGQEYILEELKISSQDRYFNLPLLAGGNGEFIGDSLAAIVLQVVYVNGVINSDIDLIKQKIQSYQWSNGLNSVVYDSFSVEFREEEQVSILMINLNVEYRAT